MFRELPVYQCCSYCILIVSTPINFNVCFFHTGFNNSERTCDKEFIIRRAATNRVLNVLRHWVSKHSQVFCCTLLLSSCNTFMLSLLNILSCCIVFWRSNSLKNQCSKGDMENLACKSMLLSK